MKTLAELNQGLALRVRTWDRFTLRREFVVSNMNRSHQGFQSSGTALHLAVMETVITDTDPQPGMLTVGGVFSVHPFCNSNGQRRGGPIKGADTDAITCKACLKRLERLSA